MPRYIRFALFALVVLLFLMSGTAAHNIFGLEVDKASRACLEFGQYAICISELKH